MTIWSLLQGNSWGSYPVILVGLLVAARGLLRMAQRMRGPVDALRYVTGFRLMIIGFSTAGIGVAWLTWQGWILAIALGIAGEELMETSGIITTLRQRQRQLDGGAG